jgi:hypothetical protein
MPPSSSDPMREPSPGIADAADWIAPLAPGIADTADLAAEIAPAGVVGIEGSDDGLDGPVGSDDGLDGPVGSVDVGCAGPVPSCGVPLGAPPPLGACGVACAPFGTDTGGIGSVFKAVSPAARARNSCAAPIAPID